MSKGYYPPNYRDKMGNDPYEALTGIKTTEEELRFRNPVTYAKAKYAASLQKKKRTQ